MIRKIILILLIFDVCALKAQQKRIDSLYVELSKTSSDTLKSKIFYNLSKRYKEVNNDSSVICLNRSLQLALKTNFTKMIAYSLGETGENYLADNQLDSALNYFTEALRYPLTDLDPKLFEILNATGNTYFFKGNYIKAYEYFLLALNKVENSNKTDHIIKAYTNVGTILKEQKKFKDALVFYNKALDLSAKSEKKGPLYIIYLNMGNAYSALSKEEKSPYLAQKALDSYITAKQLITPQYGKRGLEAKAVLYGNIGNIYADQQHYDKAINEFKNAIGVMDSIDEYIQSSLIYNNFALVYLDVKKMKEAEVYLKKAYEASLKTESPDDLMQNYEAYSKFYKIKGDYKNAYLYQFRFKELSDSLFSTDNAERRKEIELNAEFDKKETEAKALQEKREAVAEHEKQKQRIVLYAFIFGFGLMIIVAFQFYRSFRNKQKSNEIIMKQKQLVEEKQKEIVDSIHYAKRIQQSLLPTNKYIDKNINKHKDKA
jgi:tetratricopeptide (TPR) repeat protein